MKKRTFTVEELSRYNGKNGAQAFVGYRGEVYDVSDSFLWQNGRHQVLHDAGLDLTANLDEAPHGADLLKRYPAIGTLIDD